MAEGVDSVWPGEWPASLHHAGRLNLAGRLVHWLDVALLLLLTPHAVLLMTAALHCAAQPLRLLPVRPPSLDYSSPRHTPHCHREEQRETKGECVWG